MPAKTSLALLIVARAVGARAATGVRFGDPRGGWACRWRTPLDARRVRVHLSRMADQPMVFALESTRSFGEAVAASLGVQVAAHEERTFEDGEHKIRATDDVRGRDAFVVQSLHADPHASIDDKLVRLLFFVGALKDADARSVTALVPYLGYSRKDRKSHPGDPVSTRYVAQLFEAVGIDRIVALDVHNVSAYQNAFRCRSEHLEAASTLIEALVPLVGDADVAVVSPDAGGIKRAETFRRLLCTRVGRPIGAAFVEKHRLDGVVSGEMFAGDVRGRIAIIVDDLISTGTTIARAARACRDAGAERVVAAASHGVFTDGASENLGADTLERIVVTDSVLPPATVDAALRGKLARVGVAPLFADAVRRIEDARPVERR